MGYQFPRCQTCKWWKSKDIKLGECVRTSTYTPDELIDNKHDLEDMLIVDKTDEAYLLTHKDFGCVGHYA